MSVDRDPHGSRRLPTRHWTKMGWYVKRPSLSREDHTPVAARPPAKNAILVMFLDDREAIGALELSPFGIDRRPASRIRRGRRTFFQVEFSFLAGLRRERR